MEQNSDLFTSIAAALPHEDAMQIQQRLWELLAARAERYTMGDSSSVRAEVAEELLKSICFSLNLAVNGDVLRLKTENLQALLEQAWRIIENEIVIGRNLLGKAKLSAPKIENISYRDTLVGMNKFFERYDYLFLAHEIPCDIDYQLCCAVPKNLQGIEYICEYLRRIITENMFCNRFAPQTAINLLNCHCADYKGLLINLYEPIAINAIGCGLLGLPVSCLCIATEAQKNLLELFGGLSTACVQEKLFCGANAVCAELSLHPEEKKYLLTTAKNISQRIKAATENNDLSNIFLQF